jgi:hypothetical protein
VIITRKIKKEIKRPYFFYEGTFDKIDSNYFIKKIEEGIIGENNLSYKTNLKGSFISRGATKEQKKLGVKIIYE